ncbi:MAG: hypothetical protein AB8B57_06315 [Congregibacter sp.]
MTALNARLSRTLVAGALAAATLTACGQKSPEAQLDGFAHRYVEQAMHLDRLRPGEVDLYFGPQRLDTRGQPAEHSLEEMRAVVMALSADLAAFQREVQAGLQADRARRLGARVDHLGTVVAFLGGDPALTYPEQARALYGVAWLEGETPETQSARERLESNLPGRGSLRARVAGLRQRLVVPAERRRQVFEKAFAECRSRTREHWSLPSDESVDITYTRDIRAARHSYAGGGRSALLINPLAIATVDQAVDVACHEGYPGHHAQLVLFEAAAGEKGLELEDRIALLRSPLSAFREGAAVAGVDIVFPPSERLAFERDVLYPIAGLDPKLAERHNLIREDLARQALAVPAIIRDHEDRQLSDAEAINQLQSEALVASPRALFAFAHDVGAYLAGYTLIDAALTARVQTLTPAETWLQLRRWLEKPGRWLDSPKES